LIESTYAIDNPELFDSESEIEAKKKQLKEKLESDKL